MRISIILLLLLFGECIAHSQLVTNFTIRVMADIVDTGINTNATQTTLNIKPGTSAKDTVLSDGLVWRYNTQKANGETNELSFWAARVYIKDALKATAYDKNRSESQITLNKLTQLLTTDIDLLTASDLNQLSTIAAKAP